jgi:hypothetical protein
MLDCNALFHVNTTAQNTTIPSNPETIISLDLSNSKINFKSRLLNLLIWNI